MKKPILTDGKLPPEIIERIRRHSDGAEMLKSRMARCHYCNHNSVKLFEDSRGHVQAKCNACGRESLYNAVLCRNGTVQFRLIREKIQS
jgi:uncharacterized protein with PIN domain